MFEEGAWSEAEGTPPPPARALPPAPPRPPARLRAALRRLRASLGPASPEEEEEEEEGGGAAFGPPPRRRPRRPPAPPATGGSSAAAAAEGKRLSRRQWRNRQKNKRRRKNKFKPGGGGEEEEEEGRPPPEGPAAALRLRLEERLDAARFRYLNQQLYTRPSHEAARLFHQDPEAFAVYHRGFSRQVARWPHNPVQRLVRYLRNRPASLVVADFGCGDCTLARSIRNKVHCFDVVALDPRVTVCDMAQVPLEAESVDVAVFCLSLMGTNLQEILEEANRVLRVGGILLVAEVASRFADLRAFLGALSWLGFQLVSQDVSGSHFYTLELRKAGPPRRCGGGGGAGTRKTPAGLALLPCLYKRR